MPFVLKDDHERREASGISKGLRRPRGSAPSTDGSLIDRVKMGDSTALGVWFVRYKPFLEAHLIFKMGLSEQDAQDLVSEFVAKNVIQASCVRAYKAARGRFRNFILCALENYARDVCRAERAQKRRPPGGFTALPDRSSALGEPNKPAEPDLDWTRDVVGLALNRTQDELQRSGRPNYWRVFEVRVLNPFFDDGKRVSYETLVRECMFRSPSEASNALITAKRVFKRNLDRVVGQYARYGAGIDTEILNLQRRLKHAHSKPRKGEEYGHST